MACLQEHGVGSLSANGSILAGTAAVEYARASEHVTVQLPGGSIELRRAAANQMGSAAIVFTSPRFVLKVTHSTDEKHADATQREVCALRLMRGQAVPTLVCAAGPAILLENVGVPLGVANLPSDYATQARSILRAMRARGVRHNDLWKDDAEHMYVLELMVDREHRMRVVDFNMGSVDGSSTSCTNEGGSSSSSGSAALSSLPRSFQPTADETVLRVLDALDAIKRTIASYGRPEGWRAVHGVCRFSDPLRRLALSHRPVRNMGCPSDTQWTRRRRAVADEHPIEGAFWAVVDQVPDASDAVAHAVTAEPWAERRRNGTSLHERTRRRRQVDQEAAPVSAPPKTRALAAQSTRHERLFERHAESAGQRLPYNHAAWRVDELLPRAADVHECVERCRRCRECAAVSVSSRRRACLWFRAASLCKLDSSRRLRTARHGIQLDDFVTLAARGL